jgi:transcriptional regulator with XRE-family HTH domain
LRRHRESAGLSQEALADLCQVHRTEVGSLESGSRDPRLSTIVRLAAGLKVDPCELIGKAR